MAILYSNVAPLVLENLDADFISRFRMDFMNSHVVKIASGYASVASLIRLNELIHEEECNVKKIQLVLGMYYREGIPEQIYQEAIRINRQWNEEGIGEIKLVIPFDYHGKIYMFYSIEEDSLHIDNCYVGSHNLSATVLTENNRDQYEISSIITDSNDLNELNGLIENLFDDVVSTRIDLVDDIRRINNRGRRNRNRNWRNRFNENSVDIIDNETEVLDGNNNVLTVEEVQQCPLFARYQPHIDENLVFRFPIRVPTEAQLQRYVDSNFNPEEQPPYLWSNINTCYSEERTEGRPRNWYEMQITVTSEDRHEGYPERDSNRDENPQCFFLVTDEGDRYLSHSISDGGKNIAAIASNQLLGHWFKQRFVDAGLVRPEVECNGNILYENVITREMLDRLGIHNFVLYGTDQFIRVRPNQFRYLASGRVYSRFQGEVDARVWLLTVE